MTRRRVLALSVLLLTVAPLIIWGILLASLAPSFGSDVPIDDTASLSMGVIAGALVAPMITLGMIVFYLVHLYRKSGLDVHARVIWLVAIVFLNIFVMPFYWYAYVWRNPPDRSRLTSERTT